MPHSVVMKREKLLPGRSYAGCPTRMQSNEAKEVRPGEARLLPLVGSDETESSDPGETPGHVLVADADRSSNFVVAGE